MEDNRKEDGKDEGHAEVTFAPNAPEVRKSEAVSSEKETHQKEEKVNVDKTEAPKVSSEVATAHVEAIEHHVEALKELPVDAHPEAVQVHTDGILNAALKLSEHVDDKVEAIVPAKEVTAIPAQPSQSDNTWMFVVGALAIVAVVVAHLQGVF